MLKLIPALLIALSSSACVAAAAGAGAAGGIYLTSRGAESLVNRPLENVAAGTKAVMGEMGIVADAESSKDGGDKREFKGKQGDLDVTVKLERQGDTTTKVEVSAQKNLAEWDKDYAKQVLRRIVEKG